MRLADDVINLFRESADPMIDVKPSERLPQQSDGHVPEAESLDAWLARMGAEGLATFVGWARLAQATAATEGDRGGAGVDRGLGWLQVPRSVPYEEVEAWIAAHRPPTEVEFLIVEDPWRDDRRRRAAGAGRQLGRVR